MLSRTPRTFIGASTFQVTGMTGERCRRVVTARITAVDGVVAVAVDLASGTVTATADRPVDRADISAAIDEAGYTLLS